MWDSAISNVFNIWHIQVRDSQQTLGACLKFEKGKQKKTQIYKKWLCEQRNLIPVIELGETPILNTVVLKKN
jgi:hypothetical protein